MKKLKLFIISILVLLFVLVILTYAAFKFEVFTVNVDFEPDNIKEMNIASKDLESINLIPITSLKLKELIRKKNEENNPVIFSLWASHCKPCIREFNIMDSLNMFSNKDLNFVILNADPIEDSRINTAKKILYSNNMTFDTYQIDVDENYRFIITEKILDKYLSKVFADFEVGFPLTKIWNSENELLYDKVGLNEDSLLNTLNILN